MSKIFHIFSILTLTMKNLKNVFAVSIIHKMDNKTWDHWNRPTDSWDIIFSGLLPDFANYRY